MAIGSVGSALTPVGGGLAPAKPSTSTTTSSEKGTFGDTLTGLIESVESSAGGANTAISKMLNGTGDVYEAMIALNKAQTTLELTACSRQMTAVYHAEARRWRDGLAWETGATWALVEQSRQRGAVPGFVARDRDGRICGWSFHLHHRNTLQIGGLSAATADATHALVDAVLDSAEARRASRAMAFTLAGAPGLEACLHARGFSVGSYRYLQRGLAGDPPVERREPRSPRGYLLRVWRSADAPAVTGVMAAAYAAADRLRPFGGEGRDEDWTEYLMQLTTETGCGRFCGPQSLVAVSAQGIDGAALVTDLGARTSHLAQLVVAPAAHGKGLGRWLLSEAIADAARAGFERMTLLVSEQNHVARSLYDRLGFQQRATFVTAAH